MARELSQSKLWKASALCLWLSAVGCVDGARQASDGGADAGETQVLAKIPESVRHDLEGGRARDVVIELIDRELADASVRDAGASLARSVRPGADEVKEQADRYRALQERVLDQATSTSTHLRFQYVNMPMLHMQIDDLQSLLELARLPEVRAVYEDVQVSHDLAESLALIHQPAAESAGYLGAGTSVAVLDTGCDYTRAAFGSCASAGANGCKVAYAADFGVSDNVRDASGHGTNVSAIVLGVAPATKVLALDVFEGTSANSTTILKAVDWVITNRDKYNIVAMNLSLGYGSFTSVCGNDVFATPMANARNAGILSAVASGNEAKTTALSSPACTPSVISVGAVYDANVGGIGYTSCRDTTTAADKITCFSNSAPFLSMLAPGAQITAGDIVMSGTSQASPHVAGAIAVARAAFPNESVDATVSRLTTTGPSITDARNGVTVHRLDLNAALGGAGVVDTTSPTGSLTINSGAVATKTPAVTLGLSANDENLPVTMCISNTTNCTSFVTLAATKSWTLPSGEGSKTVYATVRDRSGNKTVLSAAIVLDSKAPEGSKLTATPGDAQVDLSWTAATDAGSGVTSYRIQMATSTAPSCSAGKTVYTGSDLSFTHTGLTNGTVYGYHICPIDAAGNVGIGSTVTVRPAPEFDGPVGTVVINQDAQYTNKQGVTLTLSASDASGTGAMCISNTLTCTSFVAFAPTKTWALTATKGVATVRVWFRDIYGNVSAAPVSDTIIVDSVAPTGTTLTAVAANTAVLLTWTEGRDDASGIANYKVVGAVNTPPTCAAGTQVYFGNDTLKVVTGLVNGTVYGYRVCPIDAAGNVGTGAVITVRPAPEFDGPVGSVVINQDAQYTNSRTVTLTLDATDVSGVASVCMSSTSTCTSFVTYAATKTFSLAASSGVARVNVWFKDIYGNVSASPATDTIIVDTTAPISSTLKATASSGQVDLTWTASTDAASGLAGYKLRYAPKTAPTCTTGTEIYSGTDLAFTHTGLTNGLVYAYRICPFDVAGNLTTGGTVLSTPK